MLETIVIEPKKPTKHCVIWLHGLGADGHDFEGIIPELGLPNDHGIRFVFPHAPIRPVTINMHMKMRAWYDIFSLDSLDQEDEKGMKESLSLIEDLVDAQPVAKEKIVIAGFSQGGAIALLMGTTTNQAYAGIIGLSCYLPFLRSTTNKPKVKHPQQPILICHGSYDDVIPMKAGKISYDYLNESCQAIEWKEYTMGHHVCSEEIKDIGAWLRQRLLQTL